MFVSRYPHNMSFGAIEYKIIRKLLAGTELTEEEEIRADQMSRTLEQNDQSNNTQPHRHRVPSHNHGHTREPEMQFEAADEQFSPS